MNDKDYEMKAVIGQFYTTARKAFFRAEELKRMWKGKLAFVVVGKKGKFIVISETVARSCGIDVPYGERAYKKNE